MPGTFIGNPIRDANILQDDKEIPLSIKLMYGERIDFSLNEITGDLHTARHLDREAICNGLRKEPNHPLPPALSLLESIKSAKEIKYASIGTGSSAPLTQKCQVELSLVVHNGVNLSETWVNVYITVQDLNDNRPYFEEEAWNFTLSELSPVGATFRLPQAIDFDEAERSILRYGLVDESSFVCRDHFTISCQSEILACDLRLVLEKPVDFEVCQQHRLILFAEDSSSTKAVLPLIINVKNENEHQPQFIQTAVTKLSIPRDSRPGRILTQFHAVDRDAGKDGEVKFLTNSTHFHMTNGNLTLTKSLFHYPEKKIKVHVTAVDSGNPSRQSTLEIAVEIIDNEVEMRPGKIFVKPLGGEVASGLDVVILLPNSAEKDTLIALIWTDADSLAGTCSMDSIVKHFSFESAGNLMGKPTFTLKVNEPYNYSLNYEIMRRRMENSDMCVICGNSRMNLRVRLAPPPGQQFRFPNDEERFSIEESSSPIIGFYTLQPLNGVGEVLFSRDSGSPHCDRVHVHSSLGSLSIPHGIDREVISELHCRFSASDSDQPPNRISIQLVIVINDINDCAPSLARQNFTLPEFDSFVQPAINSVSAWVSLFKLDAIDPDAGLNGSVRFELRSVKIIGNGSANERIPEFYLSPVSGEVSVKRDDYPLSDREVISDIVLFVYLYDLGSPFRLSVTDQVRLTLQDVNDNIPMFFDEENEGILQNIPWYRSTDPMPGFWTQIRIYDPDMEENGTTVLSVLEKPLGSERYTYLLPNQVTILKNGRLWIAEELVTNATQQAVYLRVTDKGSRRQLHSESKLIIDLEEGQKSKNQQKRLMLGLKNGQSARQFKQKMDHKNYPLSSISLTMSKIQVVACIIGIGLISCILASICIICVVLRN